jgi:hypothetical protein
MGEEYYNVFGEIRRENVDWIKLAYNSVKWQAFWIF